MNDWVAQGPSRGNLSRARRRLLVAAMYLGLVAYAGAVAFGQDRWWVLLFFVPLVISIAIHFRFILPIAKEVNREVPRKLDERQLMVRDRAYYYAYRILGTILVLTIVSVTAATAFDAASLPLPRTSTQFSGLLAASALLVATLPATVIVWTEPDPSPDEEV